MDHQHQGFAPEAINLPDRTLTVSHATEQQESENEIEQAQLPPADTGKEAWLVLLGCSLIQIPVWGAWALSLSVLTLKKRNLTEAFRRLLSRLWRFPGILRQSS